MLPSLVTFVFIQSRAVPVRPEQSSCSDATVPSGSIAMPGVAPMNDQSEQMDDQAFMKMFNNVFGIAEQDLLPVHAPSGIAVSWIVERYKG